MLSVSPRVKDSRAQSKDSEPRNYQERPIEVSEELVALELGIQQELDSKYQELVNWDIITEPNKTKRFTELVLT
jgi:hypothetical protein